MLAPFDILPCSLEVCWHSSRTERHLRTNGLLIGVTALAYAMPVVNRNLTRDRRIPGLEVVGY